MGNDTMKAPEALVCRVCGAAMSTENLEDDAHIVSCKYCNSVYSGRQARRMAGLVEKHREARTLGRFPPQYKIRRTDNGLHMSWYSSRATAVILAIFAVTSASLGFIFKYTNEPLDQATTWASVYGPWLLAMGLFVGAAIAISIRMHLVVTPEGIHIYKRIITKHNVAKLPRKHIIQLYVMSRPDPEDEDTTIYTLRVIGSDGLGRALGDGFYVPECPLELEEAIEGILGIEYEPAATVIEAKDLECRVCGGTIRGQSLAGGELLASCGFCGTLYDADEARKLAGVQDKARQQPRARPRIPLPSRFTVVRAPGHLRVSWKLLPALSRWAIGISSLPICALLMLMAPLIHMSSARLEMTSGFLFLTAFGLLVGAIVTYCVLVLVLNGTRLEISKKRIRVRNGPLPWKPNHELPSETLAQLYVKLVEISTNKGNFISYELRAILTDGDALTLIKDLQEPEPALALEREIEDMLGIKDFYVANQV